MCQIMTSFISNPLLRLQRCEDVFLSARQPLTTKNSPKKPERFFFKSYSQGDFGILMKQYYQFEESCQGFSIVDGFKLIVSETRKEGIKINTRSSVIT